MKQSVEEIYHQHIKPLSDVEKLRLIAKIADNLVEEATGKDAVMKKNEFGGENSKIVDV